jgi:hypothetical protein
MNQKKAFTGCGIVLVILTILVLAGVIAARFLIPEVDEQIAYGLNPLFVNITEPANGSSIEINQPVTIFVDTFGDNTVESVQLLVNGSPADTGKTSSSADSQTHTFWSFTPNKEGTVTLVASAKSKDGKERISNVVYLEVVPQDQIPPALLEGNTPLPDIVTDDNPVDMPAGGPAVPPPPGFSGSGAIPDPPPFPESEDTQSMDENGTPPGESIIPIKYTFWADSILNIIFGGNAPEAPVIHGGANSCKGVIKIEDHAIDEVGFNLYRLDPGMLIMTKVATLDAQNGKAKFTYIDLSLSKGLHLYRVSAFNSTGESNSNILTANVTDDSCTNPVQMGLSFESFKLTTTTSVDRVYCYISTNGSPWKRLPEGANAFIQSSNGAFDLGPYLGVLPSPVPPETSITVNIQCWGWTGNSLVYLGASQQKWTPTGNLKLIGTSFEINGLFSGGQKFMKGDLPDTILIAPPFNVKFVHHEKNPDPELNDTYLFDLTWNWSQYGQCDENTSICNTELKKIKGFRIYSIKDNAPSLIDTVIFLIDKGTGEYQIPFTPHENDSLYFVTAYNLSEGESADSNIAVYPWKLDMAEITPGLLNIQHTIYGYNFSQMQFNKYSNGKPGELVTGYSWYHLLSSPPTVLWNFVGYATFTLPAGKRIEYGNLSWTSLDYSTDLNGALDIIGSCGIKIQIFAPNSEPLYVTNGSLFGVNSKKDVSSWMRVLSADEKEKKITFVFNPPKKTPGSDWHQCLWTLGNIKLQLGYMPDN